jgi:hypothetical protein
MSINLFSWCYHGDGKDNILSVLWSVHSLFWVGHVRCCHRTLFAGLPLLTELRPMVSTLYEKHRSRTRIILLFVSCTDIYKWSLVTYALLHVLNNKNEIWRMHWEDYCMVSLWLIVYMISIVVLARRSNTHQTTLGISRWAQEDRQVHRGRRPQCLIYKLP